jgi:hypothetical protein
MRRGVLALMLLALPVLAGCSASGEEHEAAQAAPQEDQIELRRGRRNGRELLPYMGVACRQPNSIRCDRVGLGIGVTRPARRMTASFAGHRVELTNRGGGGKAWEAFVQPARLSSGPLRVAADETGHWLGGSPVIIRFDAEYTNGASATRLLRVPLAPGWG